jgi:hypothetical protein
MMQDTIERLDREFRELPMMQASSTPTAPEVIQAERIVGVPFSADYQLFLTRYGGAMIGAYPIFGLRPVEVMGDERWSVVSVTKEYRDKRVPGTENWAIISEDQSGNPIGMDGDGVIWIHDHDFGSVLELAPSFEVYLRTNCLRVESRG